MKNGERRRRVPLLGLLPGRVLPVALVPLKISRCAENEFDTDCSTPPRPASPTKEAMHGMGLGRAELPFPSFFLSLLILDPCYLYSLACFLCFFCYPI